MFVFVCPFDMQLSVCAVKLVTEKHLLIIEMYLCFPEELRTEADNAILVVD